MVWTLRLYDENGVEIGYVEKPDRETYNYAITHPEPDWENLERRLKNYWTLQVEEDYGMDSPEWTADHGPMTLPRPPEEHLRLIQERLSHPAVADTELTDE
ncbi:hypothetical protein [Halorubrum halodurans]|uniref:Uncharacterized protein n=1 Tax=Halorubrum halodurans TaxID=1383851 RepID=A0A256IF23_9EURY|nr:hypothetical protein [Halorubrum halodurans]OYR54906.1 hypothetical protein DJ70_12820 [Halorubrum halodurans]